MRAFALWLLLAGLAWAERPNVLLICIDDLRPDLGYLGVEHARTPHLDRLANQGRVFRRHYVQVPTCGASRFALLTGMHPRRRAHLGNDAFAELAAESEPCLPRLLREAGYLTVVVGKVSHAPTGLVQRGAELVPELPLSWDTIVPPGGPWGEQHAVLFAYANGSSRERGRSPALERGPADALYPDALLAERACQQLELLADQDQPFFLAVGFYRPHLPFSAPEPAWALFDAEPPPAAPWDRAPEGLLSNLPLHASSELLANYGAHPGDNGPGQPIDEAYARSLRQGYAACVAHVDTQVGRVLARLEELDLTGDTVVVLWSDHGWHLGDHGLWGKHTLFERSLHAPLIVRLPGQPLPGHATSAIVESVDLYPTLAELCGLAVPPTLSGRSLLPLLHDPEAATDNEAIAFWSRGLTLGRSLRTDRYRYVRWTRQGRFVAEELYDHAEDPHESRNVAEARTEVVERLLERLLHLAPAETFER